MKVFFIASFSLALLACSMAIPMVAALPSSNSGALQARNGVTVNYRILAKVNNKPLTTLDLLKKMNLAYYQIYQGKNIHPSQRFAFYKDNWGAFLEKMIEEELVLNDAEQKKQIIATPEVRKEIEEVFAPNVHESILNAGLTYQEVVEMFTRSLTLEKMTGMWHWKAERAITPAKLMEIYQEEHNTSTTNAVYRYQVVTLRGPQAELLQPEIQSIYHTLRDLLVKEADQGATYDSNLFSSIIDSRKASLPTGTTISLSKLFEQNNKELNPEWAVMLDTLHSGEMSEPLLMRRAPTVNTKTADEGGAVWRIFFLKDKQLIEPIEFLQMEDALRSYLREKNYKKVRDEAIIQLKRAQAVEIAPEVLNKSFVPFRTT